MNDQLPIEWWPIERPKPYQTNPRIHSDASVRKIATSIKRFGWRQPIVVDEADVIIIGHGRLLGARQLNHRFVPVHVAVGMSAADVKALRLADNRVAQESTWEYELLNVELDELLGMDVDPRDCGFDADELAGMTLPDSDPGGGTGLGIRIDCDSADQRDELLARFEEEGLRAKAV
jgi:site-specific DNA-methyltransferase (adenine-specific)